MRVSFIKRFKITGKSNKRSQETTTKGVGKDFDYRLSKKLRWKK